MLSLKGNLDPHVFVTLKGEEVIDYGKIAFRLSLPLGTDPLIHCEEVIEHAVRAADSRFQIGQDIVDLVLCHP
jgi:hypothetical protein